jgi:ABC transporter with metal-binding/Fe-S-binding domain ATP-binding protein
MRLAVLTSGGKDSNYALHLASQEHEIVCLMTLYSMNTESYMFQSLGQELVGLQAEAMNLPLVREFTQGEKEKELKDLKRLIKGAKKEHKIEGVVTGALSSVYQASRIQKICLELGVHCFNPLWLKDQEELLDDLLKAKFKVSLVGVFSYPFEEKMIGKILDKKTVQELKNMKKKYQINPAGEGGEFESIVLDAPHFKKRIVIEKSETLWNNYAGSLIIKEAYLEKK